MSQIHRSENSTSTTASNGTPLSMIIALLFAIVFLIGTAIYTDYQQKDYEAVTSLRSTMNHTLNNNIASLKLSVSNGYRTKVFVPARIIWVSDSRNCEHDSSDVFAVDTYSCSVRVYAQTAKGALYSFNYSLTTPSTQINDCKFNANCTRLELAESNLSISDVSSRVGSEMDKKTYDAVFNYKPVTITM